MEGILRQPDLAEIDRLFTDSFDMDGQVVYFPVRHHSPACALHLRRTIERFRPELILIEGPSDSAELLPYIADEQSVPPFCIYYSYDDKDGKVSEEKEKYRAYYLSWPIRQSWSPFVKGHEAIRRYVSSTCLMRSV